MDRLGANDHRPAPRQERSGGDRIQVYDQTNTSALPLGTLKLGRTDCATATVSFTGSTMALSGGTIMVTLGNPRGRRDDRERDRLDELDAVRDGH